MKTKTDLDRLISQGYSLDFSQTFDEILAYFKKTFLLNGLVILITTLLLVIIVFFGLGAGELFKSFSDPAEVEALMLDKTFLIYYTLSIVFIVLLLAPLSAGFIQLNRDLDTADEVGIASVFKHYQSKYFLKIVGFTVVVQVISSALTFIPFVGTLASYVIAWFTVLGIPLIIFANLSAFDAIVYSIKIVAKNPFNILLILIVSILVSLVGFIGLCIGIFFTLPILYSAYYVLYKNIVGFEEEELVFDIEKDQSLED
ncbi:olfactory receptor [Flavobacterium agricola]|uniref:Olfactory receptor n=1 Tax=Flavobacterium agricola TaxID=2870839 RepID=A0ABY6M1D2_9FLAO|nr:olfactory receptor [Flavobacterium agricola]UYW02358.1 olfactory receptor [Flavobacterium agricola]